MDHFNKTGKILFLLHQRKNCNLLFGWLEKIYPVLPIELGLDQQFDLCITDCPALEKLWKEVKVRKEREIPVFLPFLLITSRQDVKMNTRHLWKTVDELIFCPIEKLEFQSRIEVLLRTRRLSQKLKMHEEELKLEKEKYRILFDSAGDSIFIHDSNGKILSVNATACNEYGYRFDEFISLNFKEIDTPEQSLYGDERITQLMQQGYLSFETVHKRRDNSNFYVDVNARKILFQGQHVIMSICRNITERKQAEDTLRRRQVMMARTESIAHIGSWEWDIAMDNMTWSDELFRIFQMDPARGTSSFVKQYKLFHPEDLARLRQVIETIIYNGISYEMEINIIRSDGKTRVCLVQFHRDMGPDGRYLRLFGSFQDITGRKRDEDLLKARTRLLLLASSHSLEELLEETLNEAEKLTGSLIGFYHFIDPDQNTISMQNWSTRTMKEFCKAEGKRLHCEIDSAGVWADCFHRRRPVIHNDYPSLSHKKGMPPDHVTMVRELLVPVIRGDRIIAILGVGNKPENYDEEDVRIVSLCAGLVWDIIEHKQLDEALRKSEE
jgi:PAS domain S-box-containing protein